MRRGLSRHSGRESERAGERWSLLRVQLAPCSVPVEGAIAGKHIVILLPRFVDRYLNVLMYSVILFVSQICTN